MSPSRLLSGILFAMILIGVPGCPGWSPPPTDSTKSASISVGDAKDAIQRGQKKLDDADKKAQILQPKIAATNDPDLIAGFSALWENVKGAMGDFREAVVQAVQAQIKAESDQNELTQFRKADPVKKTLQWTATGLYLISGILFLAICATFMAITAVFVTSIMSREDLFIAFGAALVLGAFFDILAKKMQTLENIIWCAAIGVAILGLLICAYKWWRTRSGAVKPLVQFMDHAVATGAITWTPEATALANKMQGGLAKRFVDTFQHKGVEEKPTAT